MEVDESEPMEAIDGQIEEKIPKPKARKVKSVDSMGDLLADRTVRESTKAKTTENLARLKEEVAKPKIKREPKEKVKFLQEDLLEEALQVEVILTNLISITNMLVFYSKRIFDGCIKGS
jgi:hypothetical protein